MITYVIPTRDRPTRLRETLNALEALGDHACCGGAEVVVVDNASAERLVLPRALRSGVAVKGVLLTENQGAAARNLGASAADLRSDWIVMLDDDSFPRGLEFVPRLAAMAPDSTGFLRMRRHNRTCSGRRRMCTGSPSGMGCRARASSSPAS